MSSPINNKNNEVIVGARAAFRPPIKNSKFAMSSPWKKMKLIRTNSSH